MRYKLLITDIDGTLLNDEHKISPNNLKSLKDLQEKGVYVLLCSGRGLKSISSFEKELGLNVDGNYGIGFHGSVIHNSYTKDIIKEFSLESPIVSKICFIAKNLPISILIYRDGRLYTTKTTALTDSYEVVSGQKCHLIDNDELLKGNVSKLLFTGSREHLNKLFTMITPEIDKYCNHFFSATNYYEFISKEASKGNGLKYICNMLNIDLSETVSIGDNFNDLSLIKEAGVGVAVKNAVEPLKDISDYVTINDNNNDAITEVCNKFFNG